MKSFFSTGWNFIYLALLGVIYSFGFYLISKASERNLTAPAPLSLLMSFLIILMVINISLISYKISLISLLKHKKKLGKLVIITSPLLFIVTFIILLMLYFIILFALNIELVEILYFPVAGIACLVSLILIITKSIKETKKPSSATAVLFKVNSQ